jgi:threonine/homoserine/homoserine lactone efflux protein
MIGLLAQGMGFGFAAGTSPGPLQSYLIGTTLGRGWQRGILIIFSPLISDAPIIILMTLVLRQLPDGAIRVIQIAGGLFVLYLAWSNWRALRAGTLIGTDLDETPHAGRRTLLQAVGINMLSPGPYIFWGSVTGPILIDALARSLLHGAAFLVSFYGTFLVIMGFMVLAFDQLRRLDERITRGALVVAICVLAALGIVLLTQGIRG